MNISKAKYLILFLFFFAIAVSYAQNSQFSGNTREVCEQLIKESIEETNDNNYADAMKKLGQAELIAEQNQWNDLLIDIYLDMGNVFLYLSDSGQALDYYRKSLNITENTGDPKRSSARPLANIALLYQTEGKHKEASNYNSKAYEMVKNDKKSSLRKHIACNMASNYLKTGQVQKAFDILNETQEAVEDVQINFLWNLNYAKALLADKQIEKAQNLAEQLYAELDLGDQKDYGSKCHVCIVEIISEIYTELHETDKAIDHAKEALLHSVELKDRADMLQELSTLYQKKGDLIRALQYKDSLLMTKDSISVRNSKGQYEANKVKLGLQESQNEFKTKEKQQSTERIIFILLILLGVVLFFSVYRGLKNRMYRQQQQVLVKNLELEKEKKEHLLAEEQLKNEIADKNRELSSKALYLSSRNELIRDIITSLENHNKITGDKETAQQINIIRNFLRTDDHQDDFVYHFESVNPNFLKRLKELHPQLTSNDIRFLCYIFMNLSLKEISMFLNITYNACEKRNRRIKEKMNLKENSLYDYVLQIGG